MLNKAHRRALGPSVSITCALVLATTACSDSGAAPSGEPLVIDGEQIASAELMDAAREEGELVVYSAVSEEPQQALLEAFTEDTGVETELVRVPTNRMFERVQTEFGADQIAADVLTMPDITYIRQLAEDGLYRAYKTPSDGEIDAEYKNEDGLFYAWTLGPTAFGVNTAELSEGDIPRSYEDLLNPALRGRIGFAGMDVGTTAWVISMYERETYGVEFWEQLAAQEPKLAPGNSQVADQLGRGEIAVGITRPNVILEQKDQGAPVEMIWPEDGVPVFPFYLGIVANSEHPKAAELYMNWAMSKHGQRTAGEQTGEYPVRSDVDPPQMLGTTFPPLPELNAYRADEQSWVDNREAWTAEWNRIYGVGS